MGRLSGRRWAVVAAASGTVLIGGGAFWLSFTALADLAVRSGITTGQAWIWPLLVDGLIVVATVAVLALDRHRAAWYPWVLLIAGALMSVSANAAHALVAADASVPGLLAAIVAAVPPLVLLAATHLTTVLTRSTKTPAQVEIASADTPPPAPLEPMNAGEQEQEDDPRPPELPERFASDAGTAAESLPVEPAILPAAALIPAPDPTSEPIPEAMLKSEVAAPSSERTAASGRRERAEALREAGWSNKAIARELGVHASTIGRWFPRTNRPEPVTRPGADHETSAEAEQKEHDENKEQRS